MLISKTRISPKFQNRQITHNDLVFYRKYSEYTLKSINKNKFQRFINYILKKEAIPESKISKINIRVFPFRNQKGQWVIGKCNQNGEIKIFPKSRNLCLEIASKFGKKTLLSYIKNRGMAAIIHELLHIKYEKNEQEVRKLTKKYFRKFNKDKIPFAAAKFLFFT